MKKINIATVQLFSRYGEVLARPKEGDTVALAEVELSQTPPRSSGRQPKMKLSRSLYWGSLMASWLVKPAYEHNKEKAI